MPPTFTHIYVSSLGREGHLLGLVPDGGEEDGGEVPFAERGEHHGDQLALVLGPGADLMGKGVDIQLNAIVRMIV
jgi:hypothetical protein